MKGPWDIYLIVVRTFSKSPGQDGIGFNGIKNCFVPLSPLLNIFNLSLEKRIFPDELKIAKVTPICKTGDENGFGNYRPISVLPCLSKMLKRIMYKRLCNRSTTYYIRNNLAFNRVILSLAVDFAQFLRTPFLRNTSGRLLLSLVKPEQKSLLLSECFWVLRRR